MAHPDSLPLANDLAFSHGYRAGGEDAYMEFSRDEVEGAVAHAMRQQVKNPPTVLAVRGETAGRVLQLFDDGEDELVFAACRILDRMLPVTCRNIEENPSATDVIRQVIRRRTGC